MNKDEKIKNKTRIKKDDYVQVVSGEETGKRGKVLRVMPENNKVIIEGINFINRHLKKSRQHPQGGRIQMEAPIDISNVKLYCHHCQSITSSCYRFQEETEAEKDKKKKEGTETAHSSKPQKIRCCTCAKHLKI